MNKAKNILITGATGFIGQHLLEEYEEAEAEITVLTRKENPLFRSKINPAIIVGDIADEKILSDAVKGKDIIINLAAENRNINLFEKTNINGTQNIIKFANKYSVKKIIHLSSVGVVGMQYSLNKIIIDETSLCRPKNEYERTKMRAELLMIEAAKNKNTDIVILRPTNVFGEYHNNDILLNFLTHCYHCKSLYISQKAIVNYLYVKDLTCVIKKIADNTPNEPIYNIGESMPLEEFTNCVMKNLNVSIPIKYIPNFLFNFSYIFPKTIRPKIYVLSNKVEYSSDRLKSEFQYPYGLDKGIQRLIEYYLKNKKIK